MYCSDGLYKSNVNIRFESNLLVNYSGNYANGMNTASPFVFQRSNGSGVVSFTHQYPEVTSLSTMFNGSSNFNGPVQQIFNAFPNVDSCWGMFSSCISFNRPVNIPNSVTNCYSMFSGCENLNSYISISQNALNCAYMFSGCEKFNQPVDIPDSVTNCYVMFRNCNSFNSYVLMGNNVTNCRNMFSNCTNFHPDASIHFPNTVTDCSYMFNRTNLGNFIEYGRTNIYFEDLTNCHSHSYVFNTPYLRDVSIIVNNGYIDNNGVLISSYFLENVYIKVPDTEGILSHPSTASTVNWTNVRIDCTGNITSPYLISVVGWGFDSPSANTSNVHVYVKSIEDARNVISDLDYALSYNYIYNADGPTFNGYSYANGSVRKGWYTIPGGYGWALSNGWANANNYTTGFNVYIQ